MNSVALTGLVKIWIFINVASIDSCACPSFKKALWILCTRRPQEPKPSCQPKKSPIAPGPLYYVYMSLLAVFCTNAINIYAGINGLECGQSVVVAASVATFNAVELRTSFNPAHHLSLCLLMPFIATSLALFLHNKYKTPVEAGLLGAYPGRGGALGREGTFEFENVEKSWIILFWTV